MSNPNDMIELAKVYYQTWGMVTGFRSPLGEAVPRFDALKPGHQDAIAQGVAAVIKAYGLAQAQPEQASAVLPFDDEADGGFILPGNDWVQRGDRALPPTSLDGDASAILGRARIDATVEDPLDYSKRDQMSSTQFALRQSPIPTPAPVPPVLFKPDAARDRWNDTEQRWERIEQDGDLLDVEVYPTDDTTLYDIVAAEHPEWEAARVQAEVDFITKGETVEVTPVDAPAPDTQAAFRMPQSIERQQAQRVDHFLRTGAVPEIDEAVVSGRVAGQTVESYEDRLAAMTPAELAERGDGTFDEPPAKVDVGGFDFEATEAQEIDERGKDALDALGLIHRLRSGGSK